MKALHEFIIELPKPLNDTFTTEGGIELYADKDFSVDRLSNRVAKVISIPSYVDTPIKPGYEIMFEPTILYKQIFKKVKQDYTSYVDRKKGWFRLTPNMIILYRKDENDQWKGSGQNLMVQPIKVETPKVESEHLIIPKTVNAQKFHKEKVIMLYSNKQVQELGVNNGDTVFIDPRGGVKFYLEGQEHWWLRTKDIFAIAG